MNDHINETHPGPTGCTLEELTKEEQARECAARKWFSVVHRKEKKKKKKKKKKYRDDDKDEDDHDNMCHPSQDFNDDSQVDPEFKPTKKELKEADREGNS